MLFYKKKRFRKPQKFKDQCKLNKKCKVLYGIKNFSQVY
ncbi:hypothetical protein CHY_0087 [Carboxydothermus hydrogenoformans Z-2901]|uniref:Uncharacterized protein n=1 Tax=Carboxydothermus hydrogenoformans (strain ATCC BAA-161 / DSM 6008 / Z-2901) TaxID=246194 RepID=Q3AFX5_CARHZ|nr:hypothetical protein CHY_0087 [Carboxydothermus hydrogenoformans Z-2901]